MTSTFLQRVRARTQRLHHALRGHYWFPHVPLALLLGLGGLLVLRTSFGRHWLDYIQALAEQKVSVKLRRLPPLLIGGGMFTMSLGLLWRSRLAWVMSVLLAATAVVNTVFTWHGREQLLLAYFSFVLASLLLTWRAFDRTSIAAGTLFALTAVAMLLMYATFGSYYLGAEFKPRIGDMISALYYALVTMSTVG